MAKSSGWCHEQWLKEDVHIKDNVKEQAHGSMPAGAQKTFGLLNAFVLWAGGRKPINKYDPTLHRDLAIGESGHARRP